MTELARTTSLTLTVLVTIVPDPQDGYTAHATVMGREFRCWVPVVSDGKRRIEELIKKAMQEKE